MGNTQELKTLGDYRKVARDSLYELIYPPEKKSGSDYDAIKTALEHSKELIDFSHSETAKKLIWNVVTHPQTPYELKNHQLFNCIKLMEFAIKYKQVQSIYELLPKWPKRPDAKPQVFTSAGLSYLDAALDFVHNIGSEIINVLQSSYIKYRKEGGINDISPFKFVDKTPSVDNLKINPEPDLIIKTWFDEIMERIKTVVPESEYSYHRLTTEYNITLTHLEYEYNKWIKSKGRGQPKNTKAEKSINNLKELLKDETIFSDMPRDTRVDSWEWIANKIGYPKNPDNETPRYKIMQGYLGRNCPKLYKKLIKIMEKN